ncbi:MAG: DUF4367 domain-containing protein [Firmicutes bacterium]|nr:DUF4367 domain-containing protein [Bacillota bacterium]
MLTFRGLFILLVAVAAVTVLWFQVTEAAIPDQENPAMAILRRVARESENLRFEGTQVMIYWSPRGAKASIVRIAREGLSKVRIEYLPSADNPYRLFISDGSRIWTYAPSQKIVTSQPVGPRSYSVQFPIEGVYMKNLDLAGENYMVKLLGRAVVAGRRSYAILLSPKYRGNPIRRIWVDSENPVILRTEEFDDNKNLTYLSYFVRIDFPSDIPDGLFDFAPPPGVKVICEKEQPTMVPPQDLRRKFGSDIIFPSFSTLGYSLEGGAPAKLGPVACIHLQYSDGFNVVSFFQTLSADRSRIHLQNAETVEVNGSKADLVEEPRANILRWEADGRNLFLVGNVSKDILIKMAESVKISDGVRRSEGLIEDLASKFLLILTRH